MCGNCFQVLGVGAAVGRVLTADDDRAPGGHPVAALALEYWQSRFNGDPKIVSRKILVNDLPMNIVGVSAAGFSGLSPERLPKSSSRLQCRRRSTRAGVNLEELRSRWLQVFGRRKIVVTNDPVKANRQAVFRQVIGLEIGEKEFATASNFTRETSWQMTIGATRGRC